MDLAKHPALRTALLLLGVLALPAQAAELVSIPGVTLIEAGQNDGDSFKVNAGGRELHLRLYYVDCPETTYGSKAMLERIREQQRHFGLDDLRTVVDFGEQATEYTQQALSRPFTVHTSYAKAFGGPRNYAFIETHDGRDLGHLLVEQGLARVHGKTRSSPDDTPSETVLEELRDLGAAAMLKRTGIWPGDQSRPPHRTTQTAAGGRPGNKGFTPGFIENTHSGRQANGLKHRIERRTPTTSPYRPG